MRLGCISTSAYVFIMAISYKLVGFTFTEGEIGFSLQINSKLKIPPRGIRYEYYGIRLILSQKVQIFNNLLAKKIAGT